MDLQARLLVIAILASVTAAGVGIACLIRIDQLESFLRYTYRPGGRGAARLNGRGRLIQFPGQQPRGPR